MFVSPRSIQSTCAAVKRGTTGQSTGCWRGDEQSRWLVVSALEGLGRFRPSSPAPRTCPVSAPPYLLSRGRRTENGDGFGQEMLASWETASARAIGRDG